MNAAFRLLRWLGVGAILIGGSGLPSGLALDPTTGLITGMPDQAGTCPLVFSATNRMGSCAWDSTLFVNLAAAIAPPGIESRGVVPADYAKSFEFAVKSYNKPEAFAAQGLPTGLSIDPRTGIISGRPAAFGDFEVSLTVSNQFGTGTGHLTIQVPDVVGWGLNSDADYTPRGANNVVAIAAGGFHVAYMHFAYSLVLTDDGKVMEWSGYEVPPSSGFPVAVSNVVAIAAGPTHSLALTSGGQVIQWSDGSGAQRPPVPDGLSNVVAIAAGESHSLALTSEGGVVAWGESWGGLTNVPTGLRNVVAVAAGRLHSLALTAAGGVVAWGHDESGATEVPANLTNAVAIAAGYGQSLALTADGQVVQWGQTSMLDSNPDGPLTLPAGLTNVIAISAGWSHNLALTTEGRVVSWGTGRLASLTPDPLGSVLEIAAGGPWHNLALLTMPPDTTAPAWFGPRRLVATAGLPFFHRIRVRNGASHYGAVGLPAGLELDPSTGLVQGIPERPGTYPLLLSATNRMGSCAWDLTLFVNAVGAPSIISPGLVTVGLGARFVFSVAAYDAPDRWVAEGLPTGLEIDASTGVIVGIPTRSGDFPVNLTASNRHGMSTSTFTLRVSPVLVWGQHHEGGRLVPMKSPEGVTDVVAVSIALNHGLALTAEGRVVGWGSNANVPGWLGRAVAISAGGNHSMALQADGTAVCWASGPQSPPYPPRTLGGVAAISAGGNHSLALTSEGQVVAWGDNSSGQTRVPSGLSHVVAVAAGREHSLALTDDGRVVAWGANGAGTTVVPAGSRPFVAIAAGGDHNLALTDEGRVVAWGDPGSGATAVPPELGRVVAIAAGMSHSLALTATGRLVAWGIGGLLHARPTSPADGLEGALTIAAGGDNDVVLLRQSSLPEPFLELSRTDDGLQMQAVGTPGVSCLLLRAAKIFGPWLPTDPVTFTQPQQPVRLPDSSPPHQFFRLLRK